ncbi:transport protein particle complex subunit [Pseudozyma hubeiensis SY62]|uniref:Transport protein particle complex subunit n=1 Tax=Pseudozyma hubeiensis (strain SY62) TaxID=1305764 RepID=R9P0J2_PSEHS|nr:transport protein particle complex subunit [Pseudozyma hubeiensis SY62]GAC94624.1 transport protein particle complex subunit [Pseudozyma hubeiensis SY62]
MIAHSALDTIEDALITSPYLYLKSIDRIQEYTTSCFVLPGNVKMVLLHEHKHEDGIKNFFLDVWEAYLKVSLNPFQDLNAPIENAAFDARVRAAAKKFL